MAYRSIVSRREGGRDEYSDQSWVDEELEITDRYGNGVATSDEIPLLFEEVRQTYDIQSEQAVQVDLHPPPPEQETEAAFEEAFSRLQNENANNLKGCANCSKQVRVEHVASFRRGQHLAMPGQKGRIYNKISRKLTHPYKHHAIVKNVICTAGTRVKMELIHFTKENKSIEIFETTETYDLAYDEIMIVHYTHPRYTTDEIVRRAESMLPQNAGERSSFKSYNPFTRNCEHFATWCVVGEGQSLQVCGLREKIGEGLRKIFGDGSNIAKGILRLLYISSDEIAGAMTKAIYVPGIVLVGTSAIYLIYCIVMTVVHVKDYRKGEMCWRCCKRKLVDLWATFGVFCVTSAITFVIFHFALPLLTPKVGIPLMILLLLLSGLLQWSVPKIRCALQSPFNVDKENVNKLSDLNLGDVVSLRYYGLVHDMILTEVHEENSSSTAGRIRCVHYGLPTLFGTREIMEEYFYVNLENSTLKRFDCRHFLCNSNETVVRRAKKRVGETKWAMLSNRSDHFCFWAKMRQRPRGECIEWDSEELGPSKSKNLSSLLIRKDEVNLMEDIQVGDILQHETVGVLSGIRSLDSAYGRVFEIDQIIYEGWIVRSKTFRVNLNKDKVYVKKFHPAHCHPMETRASRARGWIDRKGEWWTTDGFIEECIMLNP